MTTTSSKVHGLSWRMRHHPYQTLLVAAGVGYILGGGLFTRLTLNLLRVGFRMGALPIAQRELLGVAQAATGAKSNPTIRSEARP